MKTTSRNKSLFLLAGIALFFTSFQQADAQPGTYVSHETFYHELSPYGQWIYDREFGRVWLPDVDRGFHPYMTNGYWVMTEYGNTWVSDYAWGWAPFHYGRWHLDNYYGWMWVPGTEWGPAWVAWRNGGGYYGWAPLGPRVNINISVNIGRHIPDPYWSFVRYGHFTRRNVYRYCAPRPQVTNIIHQTTIINNTYVHDGRHTYYTGPGVRDVERATRQRVRVHQVNQVDRPGNTVVRNGAVDMYRPGSRGNRSEVDASTSRSNRGTEYRDSRSGSSRYEQRTTPRSSERYDSRQPGRVNTFDRNSDNARSYPSRGATDNTRSRTYGNSRETDVRQNNERGRTESNTRLQRSGSTPQRYERSGETPSTRSRNNGSIERSPATRSSESNGRSGRGSSTYQRGGQSQRSGSIERSSGSRSSGNNTRGNSSYQRGSRSSSSPASSGSPATSEKESRGRSSRGSRGGGQ